MTELPYQHVSACLASGTPIGEDVLGQFRQVLAGLRPHLAAQVYAQLHRAGCMDIEIAHIAGRSLRQVTSLLEFAQAPSPVVEMVAQRKTSVAAALKAVRLAKETGREAQDLLQAAVTAVPPQAKRPHKKTSSSAAAPLVKALLRANVPDQLRAGIAEGAKVVQIKSDDAERLLAVLDVLAPDSRRRA